MSPLSLLPSSLEFRAHAWDPEAYATRYYPAGLVGRENHALLGHQAEIWARITGAGSSPAISLLVLGGGGTLWDLIGAAPHVREIWYTDPFEQSLDLVRRYRATTTETNWDAYIAAALGYEQDQPVSEEMIVRRRRLLCDRLTHIGAGDVRQSTVLPWQPRGKLAVASHFVLESITDSKATWRDLLGNLAGAVQRDNYFLFSSLIGARGWCSSSDGGVTQPAVFLEAREIPDVLGRLGLDCFYRGYVEVEDRHRGDYQGLLVTASVRR